MYITIYGVKQRVNQLIKEQIKFASDKFGNTNYNEEWLAILGEEFGELTKAVNMVRLHPQGPPEQKDDIKRELVQIMAVSLRWLNSIKD